MMKKIRWTTVAEVVSRVGSIVTVPILTRLLVPTEYGIYRSIFLIVAVLSIHGALSFPSIFRKQLPQLPDGSERGELVSTVLLSTVLLLVSSFLILVAAASTGALNVVSVEVQEFVEDNLGLVFVLLVFHPLFTVCLGILTGLRDFRKYAFVRSASELLILAGIAGLGLGGVLSVVTALWAVAAIKLLSTAVVLFWIRDPLLSWPDFETLMWQVREISIPLFPRYLIKKGETLVPNAVVLTVFGPAVFAAWNVILAFDRLFVLFSRPLSSVFLPELSSRISDGEPITPILENFYLFMSVMVVPIVIGGWIVSTEIVAIVFGADYVVKSLLAPLLITAFGCKVLTTIDSHYYIARGRSEFESVAGIAGGVAFGICLYLAVYVFESVLVIALGLAASWFIRLVIGWAYQQRTSDLSTPTPGRVAKFATALTVMVAVVTSLKPYITGIATLLTVIGIGAGLYFSSLLLLRFFNSEEYDIVRRFLSAPDVLNRT